ncbi:hypothetical protein C8035_v000111 [Colletotrichum spinosum]|uniref:Uncharacterized protein n=1 Tax=Colletotrichum spinosum TaxID=1347390 RepID=A0A4R8PU49_9PEZI|nr:hypothetical protein C8035_v000111 [Colletotrichum spinosum]
MFSKAIAVLAAATLTSAATPPGFMPQSNTPLIVSFGGISALDGVNLPRDSSQNVPTIATEKKLDGQFAVMMVDIDVPTNEPPKTGTLLHWMQTGFSSADSPTILNTTAGTRTVFLMQNKMNAAALAPYFGPNPPAREPLSHRYTFIAVDHTKISQQGLMALSGAAQNRRDFNPMNVLMAAGLQDKVVAGNFFRVTNAGPVGAGQGGNGTGATRPPPSAPSTGTPTTPGMPGMPGMTPPMPSMSMGPGMPPMPGMPGMNPSSPPAGGAQPSNPMKAAGSTVTPSFGIFSLCIVALGSLSLSLLL